MRSYNQLASGLEGFSDTGLIYCYVFALLGIGDNVRRSDSASLRVGTYAVAEPRHAWNQAPHTRPGLVQSVLVGAPGVQLSPAALCLRLLHLAPGDWRWRDQLAVFLQHGSRLR